MLLFDGGLANEKLPSLTVMISKCGGALTDFWPRFLDGHRRETAYRTFARTALGVRVGIGFVVDPTFRIAHRHVSILLEQVHGTFGGVDWDLSEVRTTQALQLCIQ